MHGRAPLPALTSAQHRVLNTIEKHIDARGYPPSQRELAQSVQLSKSTVDAHVDRLVTLGYLERDAGEARGLRVVVSSSEARVVDLMPIRKAHLCDRCKREVG